jgi:NitT/TauT family transport system substrate-binding protein
MNSKSPRFISVFLVLIIALVALGCAQPATPAAPAPQQPEQAEPAPTEAAPQPTEAEAPQEMEQVTVVVAHAAPDRGEESATFATPKHLGFFEEEGLQVDWQYAQGSAAAVQALISGAADVAIANPEVVFTARNEGADVKHFVAVKGRGGYAIAVLQDSPIQSLEDLEGKTIGVSSMGSGAVPIITGELEQLDLQQPEDYEFAAVGIGAQAATALTQGNVDALGLWDAQYAIIGNQGIDLRQIKLPVIEKLAPYGMVATEDFLKNNRDVAVGVCRAVVKGLYWAQANPEAAIQFFFEEYPGQMSTDVSEEQDVADSANVLRGWLANASFGHEQEWGREVPERWDFSRNQYLETGVLESAGEATEYYTNEIIDDCNNFDHEQVIENAKNYSP